MRSSLVALPCLVVVAYASVIIPEGQAPFTLNRDGYNLNLNEMRLVQLAHNQEPIWISEYEKIRLRADGVNFFDITDAQDLGQSTQQQLHSLASFPTPNATEQVNSVIKTLSTDGPKKNLEKFTSFFNRYYRSTTGRESQKWLLSTIGAITDQHASRSSQEVITIAEFPHSWGQNSIIAKIVGTTKPDESVIISAHLDSTNMWPFLAAPGADDDGSGSVTILEAYRALLASNFTPARSVEFHWYAGEEGGLLGSQAVAKSYEANKANIYAQIQFDMTAWVKQGTREEAGIITDFTDPDLTAFNKKLVEKYLSIPWVETKCGYACSDHASWTKAGYRSAFTIESKFENSNKHVHSVNDRIDVSDEFSFDHLLEFAKLAVAFAIELGNPKA